VAIKGDYSKRLSYKEKMEFDQLEKDLPLLEKKRDELSSQIQGEQDHEKLLAMGAELGRIAQTLDEAEMRWLELSERAS
jgi:ATP-binding cassette subfamily F protein uup